MNATFRAASTWSLMPGSLSHGRPIACPPPRSFVALLPAFLFSCCIRADAEHITIELPTRIGETIHLEMITTRERRPVGQKPTKASVTTPVRVEVLEATDEQTVIGWTTGKPTIDGPRFDALAPEALDQLLALAKELTIEIVLDEEYTPYAIRNVDQLKEFSLKAIDIMERSSAKDPAFAKVAPRVRQLFRDPAAIQNIYLQKPGRYFLIYGWEIEPGTPRRQEAELPSAFSSKPLPAMITIELKPFQDGAEFYEVLYKQELDKEGVTQLIRETAQRFAGDRFNPDQPLPTIDITDEGEFKINRQTGWVEHARIVRTSSHDQGVQIDTVEFRVATSQPEGPKAEKASE